MRSTFDASAARGAVFNGNPPHGSDAGSYPVGEVFDT
jgi:hypothetical protein